MVQMERSLRPRIGFELKVFGAVKLEQLLETMSNDKPSDVFRSVLTGVEEGIWVLRRDSTVVLTEKGVVEFSSND